MKYTHQLQARLYINAMLKLLRLYFLFMEEKMRIYQRNLLKE
eukprot:UN13341